MKIIKRLVLGLVFLTTLAANNASAAINDLFISEYVEGSSFNKAIELYNGQAKTIDLAEYRLDFYLDGSPTPTFSCPLSGLLTANTTFVIANSRAASEILIVTDFTSSGVWFDGDDVVTLTHKGMVIDSIGQVGTNDANLSGDGLLRSRDRTMRRLPMNAKPDVNIYDEVNFSDQWESFDRNNFDGLGRFITVERGFYLAKQAAVEQLIISSE